MPSAAAIAGLIPKRLASGWLPPLITIGYCALGLQALFGPRLHSEGFRYAGISGTAFFVGLLAFHLKQVVLDSKDRLLPGAPRRPLLVAGVLFMVYLVAMPLLIYWLRPASLLSQTAVTWLVAASVVQFVVRAHWLAGVVPAGLYIASLAGGASLHERIAGVVDIPQVAWSLIGVSCAWFALCASLLAQMTGESRGYQAIGRRNGWWSSAASTSEAAQPWRDPARAKWLGFLSPTHQRFEQIARRAISGNLWARAQRWRCVGQRPYTAWVMLLLIGSMQIWTTRSFGAATETPPIYLMPLGIMFVMAVGLTATSYAQQRQYRSADLLKPIARERYFREMGLALALELFRNVGAVLLVTGVLMILFAANSLLLVPIEQVLLTLLLIGGGTVLSFGCLAWFLRYRLLVVVGIFIPGMLVASTLIIPATRISMLAVPVALGMALLGALISYDAYRRWLQTEMD